MSLEPEDLMPPSADPPWLTIAKREIGVRELPGERVNKRIVEYFSHTRLGGLAGDDSTPWCAAFVGFCLDTAGQKGTRRANARSYLDWGDKLEEPRVGCVAVLWRGSIESTAGHVGFFIESPKTHRVILLGGNQNNCVSYQEYGTGRVLEYRWPKGVP